MQAKIKCSECGAEITNLSMNWGYKHWLIIVPFLLLAFIPMWRLMKPKGDYREDLNVSVVEQRPRDAYLDIVGSIENNGRTTWENVEINAEFYDSEGKFIDEESGRVSGSIQPGETENFKIKVFASNEAILGDDVEMRVKVAAAHAPFM